MQIKYQVKGVIGFERKEKSEAEFKNWIWIEFKQAEEDSTLSKGVEVQNCMLCIKDSKSTPWAESKGPGERTVEGK